MAALVHRQQHDESIPTTMPQVHIVLPSHNSVLATFGCFPVRPAVLSPLRLREPRPLRVSVCLKLQKHRLPE